MLGAPGSRQAEPEYKVNFRAFRWGALKGTPTARLRRALGKAEPVFEALRLRMGLQILPGSLRLPRHPLSSLTQLQKILKKTYDLDLLQIFSVFST